MQSWESNERRPKKERRLSALDEPRLIFEGTIDIRYERCEGGKREPFK